MTKSPRSFLLAACCTVVLAAPAFAAGPAPDDPTHPATTPRVGGSPADAEFRAVIQQTGEEYRQKRAECRRLSSAERGTCLSDAKAALQKQRADAKAAHDEAIRAARAARRGGAAGTNP